GRDLAGLELLEPQPRVAHPARDLLLDAVAPLVIAHLVVVAAVPGVVDVPGGTADGVAQVLELVLLGLVLGLPARTLLGLGLEVVGVAPAVEGPAGGAGRRRARALALLG